MESSSSDQFVSVNATALVDFLMNDRQPEGPHQQICDILEGPELTVHYAVRINANMLAIDHPELVEVMLKTPKVFLSCLDEAIQFVQQKMARQHEDEAMGSQSFARTIKPHVHGRIQKLPAYPGIRMANVSMLRTQRDVGRLIAVPGTVVRSGHVLTRESQRQYECSRCHYKFDLVAEIDQKAQFVMPPRCPSRREKECPSQSFRPVVGTEVFADYQEIRIQEKLQSLNAGSMPRTLLVILEDDLVDTLNAGDDVEVNGILLRRWNRYLKDGERPDVEMILSANDVANANKDKGVIEMSPEQTAEFEEFWDAHEGAPLKARDSVVKSVCPQLFGMSAVKLALALTLVGGVAKTADNGTRTRGQSHLLLIGDPGTGKSQFLKFACKVTSRSVLTTGIGSTSAGLTVAAVKDSNGSFVLEAGALVLADCGVCAIDELNSIRENDRATIHEAMEQQTLSVAKAGLVCKLDTRTTIIAATNPKGKYNASDSMSINTTLASPLLSRFDVVFVLRDTQSGDWDRDVSNFILRSSCEACDDATEDSGVWGMHKLKMYIYWCRSRGTASGGGGARKEDMRIDSAASEVLQAFYRARRRSEDHNEAKTTIRMLESVVRLAQAHALLCCRPHVTLQDAVVVVDLMQQSLEGAKGQDLYGGPPAVSAQHTGFAADPDANYPQLERKVLREYGLKSSQVGAQPVQQTAGGCGRATPADTTAPRAVVYGDGAPEHMVGCSDSGRRASFSASPEASNWPVSPASRTATNSQATSSVWSQSSSGGSSAAPRSVDSAAGMSQRSPGTVGDPSAAGGWPGEAFDDNDDDEADALDLSVDVVASAPGGASRNLIAACPWSQWQVLPRWPQDGAGSSRQPAAGNFVPREPVRASRGRPGAGPAEHGASASARPPASSPWSRRSWPSPPTSAAGPPVDMARSLAAFSAATDSLASLGTAPQLTAGAAAVVVPTGSPTDGPRGMRRTLVDPAVPGPADRKRKAEDEVAAKLAAFKSGPHTTAAAGPRQKWPHVQTETAFDDEEADDLDGVF
jgi:DNA helicase MCM9